MYRDTFLLDHLFPVFRRLGISPVFPSIGKAIHLHSSSAHSHGAGIAVEIADEIVNHKIPQHLIHIYHALQILLFVQLL